MNDDEIGAALRQALAPPPVTADRWSGQKVRARVRRRREVRARRLGAVASVVVVLALVGGFFGLVTRWGGGDDDSTGGGGSGGGGAVDLSASTGAALLAAPLTLTAVPPGGGAATGAPAFTLDAVTGARVDGSVLSLSLTEPDAATLDLVGTPAGRRYVARVGRTVVATAVTLPALVGEALEVPTASPEAATALLARLRPRPADDVDRTGPGRLARPLDLHLVETARCAPVPPAGGRSVPVAGGRYCVDLTGAPVARLTAVDDLALSGPDRDGDVSLVVTVSRADRAKLATLGPPGGGYYLFAVGTHPAGALPSQPQLPTRYRSTVALVFPSREEALLFLTRLRG